MGSGVGSGVGSRVGSGDGSVMGPGEEFAMGTAAGRDGNADSLVGYEGTCN